MPLNTLPEESLGYAGHHHVLGKSQKEAFHSSHASKARQEQRGPNSRKDDDVGAILDPYSLATTWRFMTALSSYCLLGLLAYL